MTFTIDDVGLVPKPDGTFKELSLAEKQAIVDEWNKNITETPEQAAKRLEIALDAHIDSVAQSYKYESIRTMVTYATSEHLTFGPEGKAAVKFRDACYQKAIDVQKDVQAGLRPIPTEAELISEMPLFESFL